MALATAEANRLLDAKWGVAAYTAPTTPMRVALTTTVPTAATAGTEVTGGSYARQTLTAAAASGASQASNAALTYTGMPAVTVVGVDVYDSAGTPRRAEGGALTASRTTNAGDTFSIASGSLTSAFT